MKNFKRPLFLLAAIFAGVFFCVLFFQNYHRSIMCANLLANADQQVLENTDAVTDGNAIVKTQMLDSEDSINDTQAESADLQTCVTNINSSAPTASTALEHVPTHKKIEIPASFWEPTFFEDINDLSEEAKWMPLREMDIPDESLEVRVWIGFGGEYLQGLRICLNGEEWTGFYTIGHNNGQIYSLNPQTNWSSLWERLQTLGIMTLPDSSTLPDRRLIDDGVSYVVEINDATHYRTYMYGNPQYQKWPEAKQIIEIVKTLSDEFKHALPPHMSWGYWKSEE